MCQPTNQSSRVTVKLGITERETRDFTVTCPMGGGCVLPGQEWLVSTSGSIAQRTSGYRSALNCERRRCERARQSRLDSFALSVAGGAPQYRRIAYSARRRHQQAGLPPTDPIAFGVIGCASRGCAVTCRAGCKRRLSEQPRLDATEVSVARGSFGCCS